MTEETAAVYRKQIEINRRVELSYRIRAESETGAERAYLIGIADQWRDDADKLARII